LIALLSYQQRFSLPFVYSYCGDNEKDSFHALAKSYPLVQEYYGLISGLLYNLPYSFIGLFAGVLTDQIPNAKKKS